MGAASEQGSSHDKYGRDLTDSAIQGMDQINASSMHNVPCCLHLWPQDSFPEQTGGKLSSSLDGPWPREAMGNGELQRQRSCWVGVSGLFYQVRCV